MEIETCCLGKGLPLFEFEYRNEAERVLSRGKRRIKDNILLLERWSLEVEFFCNVDHANKAWVRVMGLPLHLWSRKALKKKMMMAIKVLL